MVTRLAPSALYELSSIAAPVFDRSGHVVLAITLKGFLDPAGAAEIEKLGERLVSAGEAVLPPSAARAATTIGGRKPAQSYPVRRSDRSGGGRPGGHAQRRGMDRGGHVVDGGQDLLRRTGAGSSRPSRGAWHRRRRG